jgi:hypothetical protein
VKEYGINGKLKRGRPFGTIASNRAVDDTDVIAMRIFRADDKWSLDALAAEFGVSRVTAGAICRGDVYKDVPGPITGKNAVYAKRGRKY